MLVKRLCVPSFRSIVHSRFLTTKSGENNVILTKEVNNNGLILLNRPKLLNSVSLELCTVFAKILNDWKDKKSLIVVRGNGKAFCAGGDVVTVAKSELSYSYGWAKTMYTTLYHVNKLQIPYVALIDGICMGTGLGISD